MKSVYSNKVTESLATLTYSQKKVANFVLENMNALAFDTLDDIAIKIGVSTTTVIRFARALGYSGFSEMQKDIQNDVMEKVSLPERFKSCMQSMSLDKLLIETMQNDIANINNTINGLPEEALRSAIKILSEAKHVYMLGMRSSFSLAHYAASRFGQIRPFIHLVQSIGMIFPEELTGGGPEDVCMAFLFPRYSKTTSNLIIWLKSMGVRIILFTSPNYMSIQNYGDLIIPCHIKGNSFKNSFVAPICVINYFAAALAHENSDIADVTLQRTEDFLKKGYYLGL
jgi:DNA-binding MurR/RpiR family transcriptional regulator